MQAPEDILLINPNSSSAATSMMVKLAAEAAAPRFVVTGATARHGPPMIVDMAALDAAALEVERTWQAWRDDARRWAGVIVAAFGDPGVDRLRTACAVPVVGIGEASMREAGRQGRRFGIATVTPGLADAIDARAAQLGLCAGYTGLRLTESDDPRALAANPQALEDALARAVARCIDDDGAQAVIVGGGPLGQAAVALAPRFGVPVISPIAAAVRRLHELLGTGQSR